MNLSLWDVSSRLMSIVVYMVMCVCVSTFSVDLPISDTYACVCVCLTLDQSLLSLSVCGQRISLPLSSLIPSPPSPSRDELNPRVTWVCYWLPLESLPPASSNTFTLCSTLLSLIYFCHTGPSSSRSVGTYIGVPL